MICRYWLSMLSALLLNLLLVVGTHSTHASTPQATFVVTSTADSGSNTLRSAITAANAAGEPSTIEFNIAGAGPHTIALFSPLPTITNQLHIDGLSEPGANCNTWPPTLMIQLNGAAAGVTTDGLEFSATADGSRVRGLVINRFGSDGIEINGADAVSIECNLLGTDVAGTNALANGGSGIFINGGNNSVIGGGLAGTRNLISGNTIHGILIQTNAAGTAVSGNYIGTTANGNGDLGNGVHGVSLQLAGSGNIIGGSSVGLRNIISGNGTHGISLLDTSSATIQGNRIGIRATSDLSLSNGAAGIYIDGNSHNNLIGGTTIGAGNSIAFNLDGGVIVDDGSGNAIRRNRIHDNGGLEIDLNDDGVTPNDTNPPGDLDSGANNLQNYPTITAASGIPTNVNISGILQSGLNTTYTIEFFASFNCNTTHQREGQRYLGSLVVATDGGGVAGFGTAFASGLNGGEFVTATATDAAGNTSEFSNCFPNLTPTAVTVGAAGAGAAPRSSVGVLALLLLLAGATALGARRRNT